MNKLIPIIISAIAIALVVGIGFPSYYAQVVEIQELRDKNIAVKKADRIILNLEYASPILGSADAQVTIVEFGDYQCEMCHNWFHNTRGSIIDNYVDTGKVNMIFVDLAFLGSDSPIAAQATHCANEQGKYWEYRIDSGKYAKNIQDSYNLAGQLMEYPSTPTFYLFNHQSGVVEKISGAQPFSVFVKTIDSML